MNCTICPGETRVLQTIGAERRRQCVDCGHRFTTVEVMKDERRREQAAVARVLEAAELIKAEA